MWRGKSVLTDETTCLGHVLSRAGNNMWMCLHYLHSCFMQLHRRPMLPSFPYQCHQNQGAKPPCSVCQPPAISWSVSGSSSKRLNPGRGPQTPPSCTKPSPWTQTPFLRGLSWWKLLRIAPGCPLHAVTAWQWVPSRSSLRDRTWGVTGRCRRAGCLLPARDLRLATGPPAPAPAVKGQTDEQKITSLGIWTMDPAVVNGHATAIDAGSAPELLISSTYTMQFNSYMNLSRKSERILRLTF